MPATTCDDANTSDLTDAWNAAKSCVEDHPTLAVGASLLAGAVAGFALSALLEAEGPGGRGSTADRLWSSLRNADGGRLASTLREKLERFS